jgi:hypothetical protein
LLIDCEEDRTLRAVLVGMLRGSRAIASLPATAKLDEPMAPQTAVDARARRHGVEAPTGELVLYPAGAPTGVLPSELTDQRLHLRSDLVRAGIGR